MQPKELYAKWMDMIPAKRIAETAELKSVSRHLYCLAFSKDLLIIYRPMCFWQAMLAVI